MDHRVSECRGWGGGSQSSSGMGDLSVAAYLFVLSGG